MANLLVSNRMSIHQTQETIIKMFYTKVFVGFL